MRYLLPILSLLLLILNSCATANISTKSVDGKVVECSGSYYSMLRDIDSMSLSACGGKGGSTGSKSNTAMIESMMKFIMASTP